jgi:single-strand DNA-binding protein
MNQVNIIGRVGGEIELRYTPSGKAVTEINLAVDDGFGDNKKTAWIGVTLWGPTAECASKYVSKGDRLGITGRLTQDEWEDKQTGKKQRKTKVTCESMHLLEPKRDGAQQPRRAATQDAMPPGRQQQRTMPPAPPADAPWEEDSNDDIPL